MPAESMTQNQFLASAGFAQTPGAFEAPGRYPEYPDVDLKLQKLVALKPDAPEIIQIRNTLDAARASAAAGDIPRSRGSVYDAGIQADTALLKYGRTNIWLILGVVAAFAGVLAVGMLMTRRQRRKRENLPRSRGKKRMPPWLKKKIEARKAKTNDEDEPDDDEDEDGDEEE